jgi:hypothetical protein
MAAVLAVKERRHAYVKKNSTGTTGMWAEFVFPLGRGCAMLGSCMIPVAKKKRSET